MLQKMLIFRYSSICFLLNNGLIKNSLLKETNLLVLSTAIKNLQNNLITEQQAEGFLSNTISLFNAFKISAIEKMKSQQQQAYLITCEAIANNERCEIVFCGY